MHCVSVLASNLFRRKLVAKCEAVSGAVWWVKKRESSQGVEEVGVGSEVKTEVGWR